MKHSREIRAIALPAIVSNITTPILGLVDVAVTGHIGAAVYIGAIALGGTAFNILYWLFNFLRMGTSGLTAQAYGAGNSNATALILWRSLTVAAIIGLVLFCLGSLCGKYALAFMDADDTSLELASLYFSICIYGAPAVMITYALTGWFIGMQNSKAPMWIAIATNIVNIALSTMLVFGFGLKIEGVATGTISAQWLGAVLGLVIAFRKYKPGKTPLREIFHKRHLLVFFRVNTDIFFRTACLVAVTLWFTHAGARQGIDILAANTLLLQLFMLFSFFMDGFAFAGEALAGKYYGRGDKTSLHSLIRSLVITGASFAIVFATLYALFGKHFMGVLAEDQRVVTIAQQYLPWAVAVPICGFLAFIWDGIFIGLTRTRAMLYSMAIAMLVFFIIYFTFTPLLANNALWLAFCAYLVIRGISENLFYHFLFKKPSLSK